jgi:glycyl-tRNA synthetase alpha chain
MEITQFTYFQQMTGLECKPVPVELTYGLERLCMFVQGKNNIFDIDWNNDGVKYKDIFYQSEKEYSSYNFEHADTHELLSNFDSAEKECKALLLKKLALPAYDQCLKASHLFNLLDARGVIGVAERAGYIDRIRELAKGSGSVWLSNQQ